MATLIDYILAEDVDAYSAIIERAAEVKANTPKKPKERVPMTLEHKVKMEEGRLAKLQARLAALRATQD